MKPQPGDAIGCVKCRTVFAMPEPVLDVMYIPTCPRCGTVVDGYQDATDAKERHKKASEACEEIEEELSELIQQTRSMRKGVPESGGFEALEHATERLGSLSQFAAAKSEELSHAEH